MSIKELQLFTRRLQWIQNEMKTHRIKPTLNTWLILFHVARMICHKSLALDLLFQLNTHFSQMFVASSSNSSSCDSNDTHSQVVWNSDYFEMTFNLLQNIISCLYNNQLFDEALELYSKYYFNSSSSSSSSSSSKILDSCHLKQSYKLFDHYKLEDSGQKEIDFHGFQNGNLRVFSLHWVLRFEYPTLNVSDWSLVNNPTPDVSIVVGRGKHNQSGKSRLRMAIEKELNHKFTPKIEYSVNLYNPGVLILKGESVVNWRKQNGYDHIRSPCHFRSYSST